MTRQRDEILNQLKQELTSKVGYSADLIRLDHSFADAFDRLKVRTIDLVAFAQEPPSYESACIAFEITDPLSPQQISEFRSLGAPFLFTIDRVSGRATHWSVPSTAAPTSINELEFDELIRLLQEESDALSPEAVLRAKYGVDVTPFQQYSLFDAALLPAIDGSSSRSLNQFLEEILKDSRSTYEQVVGHSLTPDDSVGLFRLIFRFLAAKMLADRSYFPDSGSWISRDPQSMIKKVESHYFPKGSTEPVLDVAEVQAVIWDKVRAGINLQNISPKVLAYVYENTFVNQETRQELDTHATPPSVAEYIVRRLPLENFPEENRYVFEPFCGHAPFLVAALGRLRALLTNDTPVEVRHRYLKERLLGIEKDAFASEVARYSLTLADYPNPNDWLIERGDVFTSLTTREYLQRARAVLCNPPFGSPHPTKAIKALGLAVEKRPPMLGFVLPHSFLDGRGFEPLRRVIDRTYGDVQTISFPESAFQAQQFSTVALIAFGLRQSPKSPLHGVDSRRSSASLTREQYREFEATRQIPPEAINSWMQKAPASGGDVTVFSRDSLHAEIASATSHLPFLGELAELHRGLEWKGKLPDHVYPTDGPSRVPGLHTVSKHFEPLYIKGHAYLDVSPAKLRTNAYKYDWGAPKVFLNRSRLSRGVWTIAAAVDRQGIAATQNFIGVWPKKQPSSLAVIAAVLSGPLANFVVYQLRGGDEGSRDNKIEHIKRIPYPDLLPQDTEHIETLVAEYTAIREEYNYVPLLTSDLLERRRRLLLEIDAYVLKGYHLKPRTEKALLDRFAGIPRPGLPMFDRYYPEGFQAFVPLHKYISKDFQRSEVASTLRRLPKVEAPGLEDWLDLG